MTARMTSCRPPRTAAPGDMPSSFRPVPGSTFGVERLPNEGNVELLYQTNLPYKNKNIKTIDIVPFIESSDSKIFGVILGVILIIVGVVLLFFVFASSSYSPYSFVLVNFRNASSNGAWK